MDRPSRNLVLYRGPGPRPRTMVRGGAWALGGSVLGLACGALAGYALDGRARSFLGLAGGGALAGAAAAWFVGNWTTPTRRAAPALRLVDAIDDVAGASEGSFPASDAPAWTSTLGARA